jgi:hypothetical protein
MEEFLLPVNRKSGDEKSFSFHFIRRSGDGKLFVNVSIGREATGKNLSSA